MASDTAAGRFVGVPSTHYFHAVWVPHDLEQLEILNIPREGRGFLSRHALWSGRAECGQHVSGIFAGPARGHDWDRTTRDRCPRCVRLVEAAEERAARA